VTSDTVFRFSVDGTSNAAYLDVDLDTCVFMDTLQSMYILRLRVRFTGITVSRPRAERLGSGAAGEMKPTRVLPFFRCSAGDG